VGTEGSSVSQMKGAFFHELGHHTERQHRFQERGYLLSKKHPHGKLQGEKDAWAIADPYLTEQRAGQKWFKRIALETYITKGKLKFVDVTDLNEE